MKIITAKAPVNIAVIKYWGKRNETLILPINDSFSSTLSTENMCSKTTVMISPDFEEDIFWLNGKKEDFVNPRLTNCIEALKERIGNKNAAYLNWKIHICSQNNFPTAAGLASSAAGYACLVYALSALYEVNGDISVIARRGSGSACRSIFGGWVRWHKGMKEDGSDSIATQIFTADHWPEMRLIVLVVNDSRKKCSSTSGMKQSVKTSQLLKYRANFVVPERTEKIIEAVRNKDFDTFAQLTMMDSNQFHAICSDTYPPCFYLNDVSKAIIDMVHTYNEFKGEIKLAYTFDAGPNACLYLKEYDLKEVVSFINHVFPTDSVLSEYYKGIPVDISPESCTKPTNLTPFGLNNLKNIIFTKVGDGPELIRNADEHLLDINGMQKIFT